MSDGLTDKRGQSSHRVTVQEAKDIADNVYRRSIELLIDTPELQNLKVGDVYKIANGLKTVVYSALIHATT